MKAFRSIIHRIRRRLAGGEGGFTLPEVLMVIVISGLIMGALSSAFVVGAKTTTVAGGRLDESHDAQQAAAYFTADAINASYFSKNTLPSGLGAGCPGFTAPDTSVGLLQWTDSGVKKNALYGIVDADDQLVRRYCEADNQVSETIMVRNIGATVPVVTCPVTVPATPCSAESAHLELKVEESSGYDYALWADPRTTGSTPTGLMGGIAIYVGGLTTLGGNSVVTVPGGGAIISQDVINCNGTNSKFDPQENVIGGNGGDCNQTDGTPPPDPLGGLPEPVLDPVLDATTTSTDNNTNPSPAPPMSTECGASRRTYQEGYYLTTDAHLKNACLSSGTYYFEDGAQLTNVTAAPGGVHIYVRQGGLFLKDVTLAALTSGDQKDVLVFMGRTNVYTSGGPAGADGQITSDGNNILKGILYAPAGKLRVQSNTTAISTVAVNVFELEFGGNSAGLIIEP